MANRKKRVSAVKVEEAVAPQPQVSPNKKAKKEETTPNNPSPTTTASKRSRTGKPRGKIKMSKVTNAAKKEEAGETKTRKVKKGVAKAVPGASGDDTADKYLQTWKNDKSNWRFQKKQQHFLCLNLLNAETIPDKLFEIAIEYFEEGRGNVFNVLAEHTEERAAKLKKTEEFNQDVSDRFDRIMKVCKAKKEIRADRKTKRINKKINATNGKVKPDEGSDEEVEGTDEEGSEEGEEDQ